MDRSIFIVVCIASIVLNVEGRLPSTIKVCSRNERNLADCIIRSVRQLQPNLATGNLGPGLQIPAIEPFSLDNFVVGRGNEYRAVGSNLVIRGGSGFLIDKMRANLNDLKFDFIITFPNLDIRGKYDLVSRLFGFNIKAKGDLYANFRNSKARISMRARKYPRNGQTYLKFDKFSIKIQPGQVRKVQLTNLFPGNLALEEIANGFISSNSDFLLNDIYPNLENSLSDVFTTIANRIASEASFDELFPNI